MEFSQSQKIKNGLSVHAKAASTMGSATGVHVGTVDHMDGNQFIKLTRNDSEDGQHHWIPMSWVEKVDDLTVYLSKTPEEFKHGLLNKIPETVGRY